MMAGTDNFNEAWNLGETIETAITSDTIENGIPSENNIDIDTEKDGIPIENGMPSENNTDIDTDTAGNPDETVALDMVVLIA